jgi:hypothetical protein
MKWHDAIANLDTSEKNTNAVYMETFETVFNNGSRYFWPREFAARVKKHWINSWVCTGATVGLAVYTFDGEPIAISTQVGKKHKEEIEFISIEAAQKIRAFIFSFIVAREKAPAIANLDEVIAESWLNKQD